MNWGKMSVFGNYIALACVRTLTQLFQNPYSSINNIDAFLVPYLQKFKISITSPITQNAIDCISYHKDLRILFSIYLSFIHPLSPKNTTQNHVPHYGSWITASPYPHFFFIYIDPTVTITILSPLSSSDHPATRLTSAPVLCHPVAKHLQVV